MDVLKDLEARGLVYQNTDLESLQARIASGPIALYCGFDPTADSLHIGNLLLILVLRRFQLAGHTPIALVGGGTGLIGDPSGKASERTLNTREVVTLWSQKIRRQLERFLDFDGVENKAILANNFDWMESLNVIDFLRGIGKNFQINYMMAKDSVNARLEKGISFTEFSYMILQAYDFLQLKELHNCCLQIGGSDQWGNITAGIELIRRTDAGKENADVEETGASQAFGLTVPLVTKSDGTKFGKTESGTIWLDSEKTSPYQFYQFWLNTDDRDVIRFLKYFTFLTMEEIDDLEEKFEKAPEQRIAQKKLALEATCIVHGRQAAERAIRISEALFGGSLSDLSGEEIAEAFSGVPSTTITTKDISTVELLVLSGLAPSKRQAREDLKNGAIYVNDVRHTEMDSVVASLNRLAGRFLVLRRGKKTYHLVKIEN
jgi:tyrosyl-tRNA synthetase